GLRPPAKSLGGLWHSLKNLANSGRKVRNALDGKRAFCIGRIKMATRGHLGISCLPPLPFRHHSLDPEASAGEVLGFIGGASVAYSPGWTPSRLRRSRRFWHHHRPA